MASNNEQVPDDAVNGEKALGLARGLEPAHLSLSLPSRLVRPYPNAQAGSESPERAYDGERPRTVGTIRQMFPRFLARLSQKRMAKAQERPSEPPSDYGAELPAYLSSCVWELTGQLVMGSERWAYPVTRSEEERAVIEYNRANAFAALLDLLRRREHNFRGVHELLRGVWHDRMPFVLYLRNFSLGARARMIEEKKLTEDPWNDHRMQSRMLRLLDPLPFLVIRNAEDMDLEDSVYSFDAGKDWQDSVQALIEAASAILLYFRESSPGVSREIELIRAARREQHTIVIAEDQPGELQAFATFSQVILSNEVTADLGVAVRQLAGRGEGRVIRGSIPTPARRWLDERRRYHLKEEVGGAVERARQCYVERRFLEALDAYMYSLGWLFVLENRDRLALVAFEAGCVYFSVREYQPAAFYLSYPAQRPGRNPPAMALEAAQLWAAALLHWFASSGGPVPDEEAANLRRAVRLTESRMPADPTPSERFKQGFIQERLAQGNADAAGVAAARQSAITAYAQHRQGGGPPLFPAAQALALVTATVAVSIRLLRRARMRRRVKRTSLLSDFPEIRQAVLDCLDSHRDRNAIVTAAESADVAYELARFCDLVDSGSR